MKSISQEYTHHPRTLFCLLFQVNFAVAVGYSRHLVGWLFARWQEADDIMSTMLDNIDPENLVGLLDLIQSSETKEHFQKVCRVQNNSQ